MKKIIASLGLCIMMVIGTSFAEQSSTKVYVCMGPYATVYHKSKKCASNCSADVKEVTLEEAKEMGRRACKKCCR